MRDRGTARRAAVTSDRMAAVFVDLDRTLLRGASGQVLNAALVLDGVIPGNRSLPGDGLLYALYDRFGENLLAMALARAAAMVARGWSQEAVRQAGQRAVPELMTLVAPFAPGVLADFRAEGHRLVLSTTTPADMITPFAEALGFDAVVATPYEVVDGRYTGRLEGGFVWGLGKLQAVRRWAEDQGIDLADCHACSDSVFDVPLLASVGRPHAVNPDPSLCAVATARRWPIEHWDRPSGVPSVVGLEPYHLLRPCGAARDLPLRPLRRRRARARPRSGPGAAGRQPPQLLRRGRPGHRGRPAGAPGALPGQAASCSTPRSWAGWPGPSVGSRSTGAAAPPARCARPRRRCGPARWSSSCPQGTIPRGEAFFDPVLHGKTGTARLAAATGAPVVPVGLWGTERVWPRSAAAARRDPGPAPADRPGPGRPAGATWGCATPWPTPRRVMAAIADLLPAEAQARHHPSAEELARTYPGGKVPPSDGGTRPSSR